MRWGPLPSFSASPVVGGGGRTKEAASRDCSFTKSHPIEKRGLGALRPPLPLPKGWGNPAACRWGKGLDLVAGVPKSGAPRSLRSAVVRGWTLIPITGRRAKSLELGGGVRWF